MKMVNLTPHPIAFVDEDGKVIRTIESSGTVRAHRASVKVYDIDGIPVNRVIFGPITDLPEPEDGTVYIVSSLVAQGISERTDVYIVDDTVRDETGRIIGCRALARVW